MLYDLKAAASGINDLLADIYGEKKMISEILLAYGITEEQVQILKTERSIQFYENIRLALSCRFASYSKGMRLFNVILRRYGLFGHSKETLQEIGNSFGLSRERIRQFENRALKLIGGSGQIDVFGVLIFIAACHALDIDELKILSENENIVTNNDKPNKKITPPAGFPQANFYIQGKYNYVTHNGGYQLLMEFGDYKKYLTERNLEGQSDVSMILTAVLIGLKKLKKPCAVIVYSNTLFGITKIYKHGELRTSISQNEINYELKEEIRTLLEEKGHVLYNLNDKDLLKEKMKEYQDEQEIIFTQIDFEKE